MNSEVAISKISEHVLESWLGPVTVAIAVGVLVTFRHYEMAILAFMIYLTFVNAAIAYTLRTEVNRRLEEAELGS